MFSSAPKWKNIDKNRFTAYLSSEPAMQRIKELENGTDDVNSMTDKMTKLLLDAANSATKPRHPAYTWLSNTHFEALGPIFNNPHS